MLSLSYVAASTAILAAALYMLVRLRPFITTTTILFSSLLVVYGPLSLLFTFFSGEYGFPVRTFASEVKFPPSTFPMIVARVGDLGPVITEINFALTLMYLGIAVGVEAVNRIFPLRAHVTDIAVSSWNKKNVAYEKRVHNLLLGAVSACFLVMLIYSIKENHVGTIKQFISINVDNTARNLFRAEHGGSPSYAYRIILSAFAPMLVIWGLLAGTVEKSWPLVLSATLLLLVTLLGKIETLSKAPPAFFMLQMMLAILLVFTNRISWRIALFGGMASFAVIYAVVRTLIISPELSPLALAYSRIFDVETQTLVENFAVFPRLHPFMWGANLRPIAALIGVPYTPSFSIVGYTWYQDYNITSPTLFIADAWADFSYAGVLFFSVAAGAICRTIDILFLAESKSVVAIAVLCATIWGVLTLLTTSLNIALMTGGLLIAPLLAGVMITLSRCIPAFDSIADPSRSE
jgi:hypothetical protein